MNNNSMTYGQLHEKLESLGYQGKLVEINGKQGELFEFSEKPEARLLLPRRQRHDPVEPTYMNYVLMVLKSNGIIHEESLLIRQ